MTGAHWVAFMFFVLAVVVGCMNAWAFVPFALAGVAVLLFAREEETA